VKGWHADILKTYPFLRSQHDPGKVSSVVGFRQIS
jgi:hypothetical protein